MPSRFALAILGVIWAIAGCFDVKYANCHVACIQKEDFECPNHLTCIKQSADAMIGLCAPVGTPVEACFDTPDAGTDADAMEAGTGASDAMEAGTDATDGGSGPPEILCHNGNCLTLPPAVRDNLVLLLWPSNLPAVGSTVSVWADQSGKANDAHALYPSALPHVIANGVHLDPNQPGSGFAIADSPSLDFASGDFVVIVVAGLASSTDDVVLFSKSDGARTNSRKIALRWGLSSPSSGRPQAYVNDLQLVSPTDTTQPSVAVYGVRRKADHVELRLNGTVLLSDDLPAGSSTTNSETTFLGTGSLASSVADSIAAAIVVRGPIATADLEALESYLRNITIPSP